MSVRDRRVTAWTRLVLLAQQNKTRYGISPELFGLFVPMSYMVPFLMHSYADPAFCGWIVGIKSISVLLCVGLLLESYWNNQFQKYFPLYYYLTLGYCLPFTTTFLFFLGGSQMEWNVDVALNVVLLAALTNKRTFTVLALSGVAAALSLYKAGVGPITLHLDVDKVCALGYTILFSTLIGLLFARRKQQRVENREQD